RVAVDVDEIAAFVRLQVRDRHGAGVGAGVEIPVHHDEVGAGIGETERARRVRRIGQRGAGVGAGFVEQRDAGRARAGFLVPVRLRDDAGDAGRRERVRVADEIDAYDAARVVGGVD